MLCPEGVSGGDGSSSGRGGLERALLGIEQASSLPLCSSMLSLLTACYSGEQYASNFFPQSSDLKLVCIYVQIEQ